MTSMMQALMNDRTQLSKFLRALAPVSSTPVAPGNTGDGSTAFISG